MRALISTLLLCIASPAGIRCPRPSSCTSPRDYELVQLGANQTGRPSQGRGGKPQSAVIIARSPMGGLRGDIRGVQ